jgi:hypothetical protein
LREPYGIFGRAVTTILDGTPGATVPVSDAFQLDGIGCLTKPQEAAWVRPLVR